MSFSETTQEIYRLLSWLKKHPDPSVSMCADQIVECLDLVTVPDSPHEKGGRK